MALAVQSLTTEVVTPEAFAAPTTSEVVTAPGRGVYLWVKIGATATDISVVRPGTHPAGDPVDDYTETSLTSTERIIPVTAGFRDTTGEATVTFSQVNGVTALLIRAS